MVLPRGGDVILAGDRIVVIGSPQAATAWGEVLAPWEDEVKDVVIFGAGRVGTAIARELLEQGIGVQADRGEPRPRAALSPRRSRRPASTTSPASTPTSSSASRSATRRRRSSRCGRTPRTTTPRRSPASTASTFTIAIVHDAVSRAGLRARGHRRQVDPRQVTAEEIVRFAHDPRTQQVAMLENDRFEVLDITTRPSSEYVGLTFREMPIRGALIGAIVRDGTGGLPAQRRRARGRRSRDRLHRVGARRGRREGPVTPQSPATTHLGRRPPRRRVRASRSTSGPRSPSSGRCSSTSASGARAGRGRALVRRAVVAVPRRRRDRVRGRRSALERLEPRTAGIGFREGFLVVALTWLARRASSGRSPTSSPEIRSSTARSTPSSSRCRASRPRARRS